MSRGGRVGFAVRVSVQSLDASAFNVWLECLPFIPSERTQLFQAFLRVRTFYVLFAVCASALQMLELHMCATIPNRTLNHLNNPGSFLVLGMRGLSQRTELCRPGVQVSLSQFCVQAAHL